jgi:hypothetical protein
MQCGEPECEMRVIPMLVNTASTDRLVLSSIVAGYVLSCMVSVIVAYGRTPPCSSLVPFFVSSMSPCVTLFLLPLTHVAWPSPISIIVMLSLQAAPHGRAVVVRSVVCVGCQHSQSARARRHSQVS